MEDISVRLENSNSKVLELMDTVHSLESELSQAKQTIEKMKGEKKECLDKDSVIKTAKECFLDGLKEGNTWIKDNLLDYQLEDIWDASGKEKHMEDYFRGVSDTQPQEKTP